MYLVVETLERDIVGVHTSKTASHQNAVEKANTLLKARLEQTGNASYYETGIGKGDEWNRAADDGDCAWCNYQGNWDAHIIQFNMNRQSPQEEEKNAPEQAEWIYDAENECYVCSACGCAALNNYAGHSVDSAFCPACGKPATYKGTIKS